MKLEIRLQQYICIIKSATERKKNFEKRLSVIITLHFYDLKN